MLDFTTFKVAEHLVGIVIVLGETLQVGFIRKKLRRRQSSWAFAHRLPAAPRDIAPFWPPPLPETADPLPACLAEFRVARIALGGGLAFSARRSRVVVVAAGAGAPQADDHSPQR